MAKKYPYNYTEEQWNGFNYTERALLLLANECDRGVRETGPNRGKDVEKYLKSTNLGPGFPWCAAFVNWAYMEAGFPEFKDLVQNPASACSILKCNRTIKLKSGLKARIIPIKASEARRGDLMGWCGPGWRGHVGMVVRPWRDKHGNLWMHTVEGNTNAGGSREGDRATRKDRPASKLIFARLVIG